ncbi:glycosyltransferase family 2 protein [Dysgonomonas sp. 25]|uniref:glycosyltransferase family 2 protein n=1 Tax=Dysgonomonas sp. 25 TaxID=2302933 RepID=UPI0013D5B60B|nr:glycosyltransferase family 2 protein [Dysgonomonas sp. 25]NDV69030.1 glycosyltransferase [Dysgonomonas sp. 25]
MKLSVITINLNNKDGLIKTIESVIFQSFTDYEFIIIDGGSTDGSVEVIQQYADKISYWISEPDTGIYNAMNKGIKAAKGEYLHFLNTGDRLVSDEVYKKIFEGNPHESFICGNFVEEKGEQYTLNESYKERDWSEPLYDIYSGDLCHQAFFIKTDNFAKYGLYDESLRITADWKLFFIAIGMKRETVLYKDVNIVIYNMEGLSSTIGGVAIQKERRAIAEQYMPAALLKRYDRLKHLEADSYIIDFVHSRKWIYYGFHAFRKILRSIGLAK